jgi:hypothetical protein
VAVAVATKAAAETAVVVDATTVVAVDATVIAVVAVDATTGKPSLSKNLKKAHREVGLFYFPNHRQ